MRTKPTSRQPTAIVVEDNVDLLDMTAALLKLSGVKVMAKLQDGESAVQCLRDLRPDVAVMDILIPGPSGLDLLDLICREKIPTRVILVTGFLRREWVVRALEGGAAGYLIKPHVELLAPTVNAVLRGETFFGPGAAGIVSEEYLRLSRERRAQPLLTPGEIAVLLHKVNGKRVKEVAAAIQRSPKTIENTSRI